MTKNELLEIIREELAAALQEMQKPVEDELDERTVASREPPRKMTVPQIKSREGIGKKLLKSKRSIRYFKKKFGDDWKSYLYAAATNKAIPDKKETDK